MSVWGEPMPVPAMSRWAHGVLSTKRCKSWAAVIDPPSRPPVVFMSANLESSFLSCSEPSGDRHLALLVPAPPRRLKRAPGGIEADAFTDKGNRVGALFAAVPAHDHQAALVHGALPDPEQRVHAELPHCRDVEHLDDDAELLQISRAARELLGIEHVRGLVGEIAREHDAIGECIARHECPRDTGGACVAHPDL